MDFGRPNVEIGWKMANGRLLFLALQLLKCRVESYLKPLQKHVGVCSKYSNITVTALMEQQPDFHRLCNIALV